MTARYEVVVPTTGRPSLHGLLAALPDPARVIVVDDRRAPGPALAVPDGVRVIRPTRPGRGPAAARNAGWRAARAEWVVFLDDDVVPLDGWAAALAADLAAAGPDVAGSQGRIRVPLPSGRRPTDWERNVAGLEAARWATADLAYRRTALAAAAGFDERFPRAYREDADLGLRLVAAGRRIERGTRTVEHPVRPAPWWVSVAKQAGNADDVPMRALHGRAWRERAGAPPGRRPRHLAIAAAGAAAVALRGRWRAAAAAVWAAGTAELAWARIAPGPRDAREIAAMTATSAALPFAAAGWWLWGLATLPARLRTPGRAPLAVLFDRDDTLIVDVPFNGDPDRVVPMAGARDALDRLRAAGVPTGVVSNQSGVARGLITPDQVAAVNRRVEELLGPLGTWAWCPHGPGDGCACRKPRPGLVLRAAAALGVPPAACVVVGDIGADLEAARAAGARAVLVPTARTRHEEVTAAPAVAPDLLTAVDRILGAAA